MIPRLPDSCNVIEEDPERDVMNVDGFHVSGFRFQVRVHCADVCSLMRLAARLMF